MGLDGLASKSVFIMKSTLHSTKGDQEAMKFFSSNLFIPGKGDILLGYAVLLF